MEKTEATPAARRSRKTRRAGWAFTTPATDVASVTNRAVPGSRQWGTAADGWGREVKMTDVEAKKATGETEDVMMAEIVNTTVTATGTETEMGALASNDESDPTQLCKFVQLDHRGAGDESPTQGGRGVLTGATERIRTVRD